MGRIENFGFEEKDDYEGGGGEKGVGGGGGFDLIFFCEFSKERHPGKLHLTFLHQKSEKRLFAHTDDSKLACLL